MNKGLLVIGAAGSGKTFFLEELYRENREFEFVKWINPDFYVEDPNHEYYNNPLGASRYIKNEIFPEVLKEKRDFIFDTTGANLKTIQKLIDENPSYEFKILMVFANPAVTFRRNVLRKRTLPKQVLLENWHKVYSQTEEYEKLVGVGNMYIYEEYSEEELTMINSTLYYISDIIKYIDENNNTTSSFKKESTKYTEEQIQKKKEKFAEILDKIDDDFDRIYNKTVSLNCLKQEIYDILTQWISENK